MIIANRYELPAAHQLTAGVPAGHKCRRLHGHNYGLEVHIHGDVAESTGMVVEFSEVDALIRPVLDLVDHRFLNELGCDAHVTDDPTCPSSIVATCGLGFDFKAPELAARVRANPTAECLAKWLYVELRERLKTSRQVGFLKPHLIRIRLREDEHSWVEVDHA